MAQMPRKITIDAAVRPKVEAPLWAMIIGSLLLIATFATVAIPIAWGLAWLISNWP